GTAIGVLGVLGVPLSRGSITPGRCDLAPCSIRSILGKYTTFDITRGSNLEDLAVKEFGDLDIADHFPGDAAVVISSAVSSALQSVDALVILGGDNSVTRSAVRGLGQPIAECGLMTLDAHLDLRDLEGGQTNSNPIRGLLEDGLPGHNIVQSGPSSKRAAFTTTGKWCRKARRASATRRKRSGFFSVRFLAGALSTYRRSIYMTIPAASSRLRHDWSERRLLCDAAIGKSRSGVPGR